MVRDHEKKRKLDQAHADNVTPKRLKATTGDSAKKAAATTTNGASDSPVVLVSRSEHTQPTTETPKLSKAERKAAKKAKRASDVQATPGAQLRAESDDVVTPDEKRKSMGKELGVKKDEKKEASQSAQQPKSKKSKKDKKRKSVAEDTAVVKTQNDDAVLEAQDEHALRKAEKKARRQARKEASGLPDAGTRQGAWTLSSSSAGRYIHHDSIFVTDENGSSCLIAATEHEIQLLSLDTSLVVRSHTLPEERRVVAFSRSPVSDESVDIAYDNGAKVQWNWITSDVTNGTFPGQEIVIAMTSANLADGKPELFYIAEAQGLFNVVGERKVLTTTSRRLRNIQVLHNGAYIICLCGGGILVGARKDPGPQSEYTWIDLPMGQTIKCADARLVFQEPTKTKQDQRPHLMIAVGTAEGKILFYSNIDCIFRQNRSKLPEPQILHWHREKVAAVKFSKDGNYLISGGKETVLVLWQLETGAQNFLPHLTAEIENIVVSPEGNQYALHMGDNSIMVLSTSELKPIANFAGLQLPVITEQLAAENAIIPKTTALLHPHDQHKLILTVPATQPKSARDISTRPFLQTFDIRNSRHLSRQALTRNNVTDFNRSPEETPIIPPDVSLIAISPDGQFMATVDEWEVPGTDLEHLLLKRKDLDQDEISKLGEEKQKRREVYLKFWRWNVDQQVWTLSNRAEGPHSIAPDADPKMGVGQVLSLVADPSSNRFATVGQDSVVKIWTPRMRLRGGVTVKESDGTDAIDWACKRSVHLPLSTQMPSDPAADRQDSPMEMLDDSGRALYIDEASLAFSPDGSMVACAQVAENELVLPIVHFIESDTGVLKASKAGLIGPEQEVVDIAFLDKFFIALSIDAIRIWNLVDDAHMNTIILPRGPNNSILQDDALLAVNHTDETFAVVTYDFDDAKSPTPKLGVYSPKGTRPLFETKLDTLPAALLAPQNASGFTILFEDATIRTLSTTTAFTTSLVQSTADAPKNRPLALPSAETTAALALATPKQEDIEMDDAAAFVLAPGDVTAHRPAATEDDKPVVRPEHLNAILDVGQAFAMPALTEMFQSLASLHSRAPRRKKVEVEVAAA